MLRSVAAATLFAVPALVLSACSPPGEVPSDTPGTEPSVWTGSPSPSAGAGESGHLRAFGDQPLYIGLVVLGS